MPWQMSCAGTFEGVAHDEQFHDIVIDAGSAGRLDNKYILAADTFIDHDLNFAVVETVDDGIPYLCAQIRGNFACQVRIGVTGENLHVIACLITQHSYTPNYFVKNLSVRYQ